MTAKVGIRTVFALSLIAVSLIWLGTCSARKEPIRIGLAINLSGRGGTAGEYIRSGSMLAVEEINEQGGIHGHPLELIIRDDGDTAAGILAADTELIDMGVPLIIGHDYSESTLAAYPYVTGEGVLLFTPFTGTTRLSDRDDLFFRTSVDNRAYGRALGRLLFQRGVGRASCLLDMSNPSFVQDYLAETLNNYDGSITPVQCHSKQVINWEEVVPALLAADPQAIVLLSEVTVTGIAAQKLRESGFEGDLIATLWAQTPDLVRYGGKAVEDLTIITFIDSTEQNPKHDELAGKLLAAFNEPLTARSIRSYEAIYVIAEALEQCEDFTANEIKRALLEIPRFETVMGSLSFNEFGDVARPIYAIRVRDGRFFNAGEIH